MTVRAHFYKIDGRVQGGCCLGVLFGGAVWGCCLVQFGVLVQVLFGAWRFCKIDGRVLRGMQLWVLLEESRRPGVLFEELVCNAPPIFAIWGLRWCTCFEVILHRAHPYGQAKPPRAEPSPEKQVAVTGGWESTQIAQQPAASHPHQLSVPSSKSAGRRGCASCQQNGKRLLHCQGTYTVFEDGISRTNRVFSLESRDPDQNMVNLSGPGGHDRKWARHGPDSRVANSPKRARERLHSLAGRGSSNRRFGPGRMRDIRTKTRGEKQLGSPVDTPWKKHEESSWGKKKKRFWEGPIPSSERRMVTARTCPG